MQNRQQMKITRILFLTFTLSIILACGVRQEKNSESLSEIYSRMLKDGIKNQSTAPDFVVFIAKNSKTGETKEICTTSDFTYSRDIIDYQSRTIEFTNTEYTQIGADTYNKEFVDSISNIISVNTIDSIINEYKATRFSKTLVYYSAKYSNEYFAHVLFKKRILIFRDCETGYPIVKRVY